MTNDSKGRGLQQGCEVQASAGQEPFEEAGPVLHPLEPGLYQGGQLGKGCPPWFLVRAVDLGRALDQDALVIHIDSNTRTLRI